MSKGMLKVVFLVNTAYQGARHEGEELIVPSDFAIRWANNGIARIVIDPAEVQLDEAEDEIEVDEAEPVAAVEETSLPAEEDFESMSSKELYKACVARGIEVEVKQPKDVYLNLLRGTTEEEA